MKKILSLTNAALLVIAMVSQLLFPINACDNLN